MRNQILAVITSTILAPASFAVVPTNCQLFPSTAESGLVSANPASVGFNNVKLAKVDQQINSDIQKGFPGAGLVIIKDGKVIKQSVYGYSLKYNPDTLKSLKNPLPIQCNTLFDLASNTKMYSTNYALMQLVANGKLDLNRPIQYYIPEYKGCDKNGQCRETRLVRDLLSHSAGYMPDPQFFNPTTIKSYGSQLYSQNRQLTESIIINKLPFARARGGEPVYSDVDFMLLGILIERISGQNLADYVNHNIYQSLNLTHTMFNPLSNGAAKNDCAATEVMGNTRGGTISFPNIRHNPLQCQVHDEKAWYSMGGVSGHAGLFSNLHDLAILTQVALNNGSYAGIKLWTPEVESQFLAPNSFDDTYGLGWRRAGNGAKYAPFGHYASSQAFGHTGWTGTLTLIDPKYNLIIVLLTNKKHSQFANGKFVGDDYATGKYYPIVDLIYQALPNTVKQ